MSTFNQGIPSVPSVISASNVFMYSNSTSGTALSVQQLGAGGAVASFSNATGSVGLFVSATSNVGINQTAPQTLLHVTATASNSAIFIDNSLGSIGVRPSATNAGSANCHIWADSVANGTADAGFLRLAAGGGTTTGQKSYIDLSGYSGTTDIDRNIVFGTQGVERMRINQSGNVGIGTANPQNTFQVGAPVGGIVYGNNPLSQSNVIIFGNSPSMPTTAGTGTMGGTLFVNSTNANASNVGASIALGGRGADFGGGQQHMTFARIQGTQAVTNGAYYGNFVIETQNSGSLYERMRIDQNGYVGIGTQSPTQPLQVSGGSASTNTVVILENLANAGTGYGVQLAFQNIGSGTTYGMGNISVVRHNTSLNYSSDFVFSPSANSVATERMRILGDNGNVGIGVANPGYPLEVGTSVVNNFGSSYGFYSGSGFTTGVTGNQSVAGKFGGYVWSTNGFLATSDARIKNVEPEPVSNCLDSINKLRVCKYEYIDKIVDKSIKFGFVAQEVMEVVPESITTSESFVPSTFKLSERVESNVVTLTNHSLAVGDVVRLVYSDGSVETNVCSVQSTNTFQVDAVLKTDSVFVYGKKVFDFMTLDYNQIFTLTVGAIQELSSQVTTLSAENTDLKTRMSSLEQSLETSRVVTESLSARLAAAGL